MKRTLLLAALVAAPAFAQTPPASIGQPFIPAPWWMKDPVIASMGHVRTEVPANRASIAARFKKVEKSAGEATSAVAAQVRTLDAALRALGAGVVQVETTFSTSPLYEQYRDKDGNRIDNEREDRIRGYTGTASVEIEVRDMAALERAYRLVVAAAPTEIDDVSFQLQPGNAIKTAMAKSAVEDAARRARDGVAAAGTRLGPVKIIDPSGRVCQTQVLAGWPSYGSAPPARDVAAPAPASDENAESIMVTGAKRAAPATLEERADALQVTLQPPMRELTAQACVIYGLLPPG
jgi:uncharacterized protein YggE